MNIPTVTVILILTFSALAALSLALFTRRQDTTGALPFTVLAFALAEWSLTYAMELSVDTLATKTLWAQFQYIGIALIPVAWFVFAQAYAGHGEWRSLTRVSIVLVIPIITVILAFTNQMHGLLWSEIALNTEGPFVTFDASYGPFWYVFFLYAYGLLMWGSIVLFQALRTVTTYYRWQYILLLLSPILPWLANALYLLRLSPIPQLDLSSVAFTVSAVILGIGIFRFRLLMGTPVPRPSVISDLSVAVIVLNRRDRVVEINPMACQLFAWKAEPLGKPVSETLDWWVEIGDGHLQAVEAQREIDLLIRGVRRHFNLQISPLWNWRKKLTGRLVMVRDITADKLIEEAVTLAQVRTEFLAKVGHELRSPLTSILGETEMMEYGVYGPLTNEQSKAMERIIERTVHLSRMVDELLQYTQMEAGNFRLDISEFYVNDLVEQVVEFKQSAVRAKGIALITEVESDVPAVLYGDCTRLYQILVNLVENAIKFTHEGYIKMRIYRPDDVYWAVDVKDTGIGIPEDMRDHVFSAFHQADFSVTRSESGYGLGLSIVKQLVTLMGGKIALESEEGQGSVFTVYLPLAPEGGES